VDEHGGSEVVEDQSQLLRSMTAPINQPLYRRIWQLFPVPRRSGMSRQWWLVGLALLASLAVGSGLYYHRRQELVAALSRQCQALSDQEQWNDLATASEQWANLEPRKANPWLFRAEAAEGVKDWEQVVEYLDRVPRSDNRAIAALMRKANTEFQILNRPWDSMRTCDEALRLDPRVLIAHKQTIFFYAMTLQRAEMVRRIRRAIQVRRESPESYVFLVGASWLYSGSLYRHNSHWLESDPDNEIFQVARSLQVYVSLVKSDLEHAAEFEHIPPEEELLERYPHNLELVAYFLNRSITEGDFERVRELLEVVPSNLAEADARFWRARAWCEDTLGEFESAETCLRRAFAADPYWWQIHFQLHDLLRRRGRLDDSARFFEMYRVSKALAAEIKTLAQSVESLDDQKFLPSLLELAQLVEDDEVAFAVRERLSTP
jgi:tetratricopeptide (TPR) repeat protein